MFVQRCAGFAIRDAQALPKIVKSDEEKEEDDKEEDEDEEEEEDKDKDKDEDKDVQALPRL